MFSILKDRRMSYLLLANILSSIGSGITMMAIPWVLLKRADGAEIFGYVTMLSTVILFFVSPYLGVLIDRFSRKKILLFSEILGGSIVGVLGMWGFLTGHFETWQLVAIHFGGSLYYSIHFPTQFAFTQEIFDREQYQALNSVMEVQSQTASMISGGLASLLVDRIDLSWILFADATTYVCGFLLYSLIPYMRSEALNQNSKKSMWVNIAEGFAYLKEKPVLTVFLFCSLMPFLVVMAGNYLFPVYLANVLHASGTVYGFADMIYAVGATLAGLTIPLLMRRFGSYKTVVVTFLTFAAGILTTYLFPIIGVFVLAKLIHGWGNAGTRVARNTITMEIVPIHMIGRVSSFFNAAGMGTRALLIGSLTQVVAHVGASPAVLVMACLLVVCFTGVFAGRSLFMGKTVQGDGVGMKM